MKKSLIALATLAAVSGTAMAQSSVTLFGVVDAAVTVGQGSVSDKTQLTNSGYNSSRIGFRGEEDLGGGMKASFWLEGALANDNGNASGLTLQRRSTVSLSGGFGEVRLGRDYTPHFWNHTVYDPFGTNGVGTSRALAGNKGGTTAVRSDNTVGYFSPNFSGLQVQLQQAYGEQASPSKVGNMASIRVAYNSGPISVAIATGTTKTASGEITTTNWGASYDFGTVKGFILSNLDKSTGQPDQMGALIGATMRLGAGTLRVSQSGSKTDGGTGAHTTQTAIGYVYSLSKRTDLYVTYARLNNNSAANATLGGATTALGQSSSGMDLGIKHSF